MTHTRSMSRRRLLWSGLALGASATTLPNWFVEELMAQPAAQAPKSANDTPGIGVIGCGGRGRGIAEDAARYGRIVAVCDVDAIHCEKAALDFGDVPFTGDFRKLIERKEVDLIVNGTPDHWHTLINLHAIKNGKDVYTEKPLTLTIDEGKRLRAAVREHKRVLQVGSQQRSEANFLLAAELIRNKRLGKLRQVTTFLPSGLVGGPFKAAPAPKELDWDMWLGQAPKVPYVPERCHVNFRFWQEYSSGTITDWGAHHNDIARWALGVDGPVAVQGRPIVECTPGGYTTPSQYHVEYTYADGLKHVCRSTPSEGPYGNDLGEPPPGSLRNGIVFEGEHGWIYVRRGAITASDEALLKDPLPSDAVRLYASRNHMGDFFQCMRSRKDPVADVESGHRSVTLCHLGAIAMRLQRPLKWDPVKEDFVGDAEASGHVAREQRGPWTYDNV